MPLNFSCREVHDFEALHEDPSEWAITETLIWSTMWIGLPKITEDNVDEWVDRLAVNQSRGALMNHVVDDEVQPYYITREHVERRIGLSTNASRISKTEFMKNQHRANMEDGLRKMSQQKVDA